MAELNYGNWYILIRPEIYSVIYVIWYVPKETNRMSNLMPIT